MTGPIGAPPRPPEIPPLEVEDQTDAEIHDARVRELLTTVCSECPDLVGFRGQDGCQETYCRAGRDFRLCAELAAQENGEEGR